MSARTDLADLRFRHREVVEENGTLRTQLSIATDGKLAAEEHARDLLEQRTALVVEQTAERIRLSIAEMHKNSWLDLAQQEAVFQWVVYGTVPAPKEPEKEDAVTEEVPTGPSTTEPGLLVDRSELLAAINDLEIAEARIADTRKDPYLSTGKVRIQKAHVRISSALQDLRRIAGVHDE